MIRHERDIVEENRGCTIQEVAAICLEYDCTVVLFRETGPGGGNNQLVVDIPVENVQQVMDALDNVGGAWGMIVNEDGSTEELRR